MADRDPLLSPAELQAETLRREAVRIGNRRLRQLENIEVRKAQEAAARVRGSIPRRSEK